MAEILSLSNARMSMARAEKEATAAQNRTKFGRTRAEKLVEETRKLKDQKGIDGHKREP
jgi:hypothetical protein